LRQLRQNELLELAGGDGCDGGHEPVLSGESRWGDSRWAEHHRTGAQASKSGLGPGGSEVSTASTGTVQTKHWRSDRSTGQSTGNVQRMPNN
jgi:hypothetical protein